MGRGSFARVATVVFCGFFSQFSQADGGFRMSDGKDAMVLEALLPSGVCPREKRCEGWLSISSKGQDGKVLKDGFKAGFLWSEGLDHRGGWVVPEGLWKRPGTVLLEISAGPSKDASPWVSGRIEVEVYSDGQYVLKGGGQGGY